MSEKFDEVSLRPVSGLTKHDLSFNRDTLPKRQKPLQHLIDSEEQYSTVSSYPADSLNNSLVSLRSFAKTNGNTETEGDGPIEPYDEPKSPHSIISGPIHTFVIETVPEPVHESPVTSPQSLKPGQVPSFQRELSRDSSVTKFEIPKISIESDITTCGNEDTFTSFKSSADDENFSNSSIHSGTLMINGGAGFQRKFSLPRSPPETRSILVPTYDLKQKLQRQLTMEEATESSAESDDGFGSGSNTSVIQDSLSPPINRNGRKEGVISDLADTKELTIVDYAKDDM